MVLVLAGAGRPDNLETADGDLYNTFKEGNCEDCR